MEFVPGMSARDFPPPVTPDEAAARFGAPLFTLMPQPKIREADCGTVRRDDDVFIEAAMTYSVHRHPDDDEHPENFSEEAGELAEHLRAAEAAGQPEWFISALRRMRYPQLWEAVLTVRLEEVRDRPLAERLADQVNHILINTMEHRRHPSETRMFELDAEVTARHAQTGVKLNVDGKDVDALLIDTDPDVIGWAFELDGCAVLVVFARDRLPDVDLRLVRKQVAR